MAGLNGCMDKRGANARVWRAQSPLGPYTYQGDMASYSNTSGSVTRSQQFGIARVGEEILYQGVRWHHGGDVPFCQANPPVWLPLKFSPQDGRMLPIQWEDRFAVPPSREFQISGQTPVLVTETEGAGQYVYFPQTLQRVGKALLTSIQTDADALHDEGWTGRHFTSYDEGASWKEVPRPLSPWLVKPCVIQAESRALCLSYPLRRPEAGARAPLGHRTCLGIDEYPRTPPIREQRPIRRLAALYPGGAGRLP